MKYLLFIIPIFFIGCSDGKKQKLEKIKNDPSYTEITSKKINHSVRQTMGVIDPFAQKLVDIQQIGDNALIEESKRRKFKKNSQSGRKD